MPRYIDADALIEFIDVGHLRHPSELCFSELDVVNMLNHAPSEDVTEVVKCKDCVHWTTWLNRTPLVNKCHCDIHFNLGHEDFYCADGRMKEDA